MVHLVDNCRRLPARDRGHFAALDLPYPRPRAGAPRRGCSAVRALVAGRPGAQDAGLRGVPRPGADRRAPGDARAARAAARLPIGPARRVENRQRRAARPTAWRDRPALTPRTRRCRGWRRGAAPASRRVAAAAAGLRQRRRLRLTPHARLLDAAWWPLAAPAPSTPRRRARRCGARRARSARESSRSPATARLPHRPRRRAVCRRPRDRHALRHGVRAAT